MLGKARNVAMLVAVAVALPSATLKADDTPPPPEGKPAALGVAHIDAAAPTASDPTAETAPDPMTPPEVVGPPPAAPAASATATETVAAPAAPVAAGTTAGAPDAVVVEIRRKLGADLKGPTPADRDDRAALAAFYGERSEGPLWVSATGLTQSADKIIAEIRRGADWGLNPALFALPEPPAAAASPEALAEVEIKLGLAVLKYARHARGGRLNPNAVSRIIDQKPQVYDPGSVISAIAPTQQPDVYLRALHPRHPQFELLRQALLAARAETGGTTVADIGEPNRTAAKFTSTEKIQRILVNMERWRWLPDELGEIYVWDSVPEQMTRVYENGKKVLEEKIVVGKPTSPTFIFSADMQYIIFHPSWGVPAGIKSYELAPLLRKYSGGGFWFFKDTGASEVLKAQKLTLTRNGVPVDPDSVDWKTADISQYHFEQAAGATNVLGVVKFRFPNKYDVYMHDTPERHLFGGSIRAFSHGCMRVQNPVRLAEVLLAHDKGWSADKVRGFVTHGGQGEIKLDKPIPVHITYFTATVDDAGKLNFHPDIYGLDGRVASALEGKQVHLAAVTPPVSAQKVSAEPADTPTGQRKERPTRAAAAAPATEDGAAPAKPEKRSYRSAKKSKPAPEPKATSLFDW